MVPGDERKLAGKLKLPFKKIFCLYLVVCLRKKCSKTADPTQRHLYFALAIFILSLSSGLFAQFFPF